MATAIVSDDAPKSKKPRLSLSLKGKGKKKEEPLSSRFTFVADSELEEAAKGVVPENTTRVNAWALRNFEEWARARNERTKAEPVPNDLLSTDDHVKLCKWLCKFVMETRQESGKPYPPKSLYSILCGLYRVSRSNGVWFNFLDKNDVRFAEFHKTLDSVCSQLHSQGVGASTNSAAVISLEDEEVLLDRKIMSMDNPISLQNMVFFYVSLHCCLRGGQEQRDLSIQQFSRFPSDTANYEDDTYYQYTEFISKNNQHRFKDIHSKNKSVKIFAIPNSRKCPVKLLDFYFSRLPADPKAFYLRPLINTPEPGKAWYVNVPVGINTLRVMMTKMSEKGCLTTKYTNHSLRATSTSRLFASNVPEKLIQEKSGHRSLAGLRAYERTTQQQEQSMTKILDSSQLKFNDENCPPASLSMNTSSTTVSAPSFSGLHNCVFNFYNAK